MFRNVFGIVLVVALTAASPVRARMVHDFDCSFCHLTFTSDNIPLMTYNVCLTCHTPGNAGTTYPRTDGSDSNPITATFTAGDGSDAMGNNPSAAAETSHFFAGSADSQPAAGASPPADWRFNVGWASGLVTCSRCHNPHDSTGNPQLLKLGAGSADEMCRDCHSDWNQNNNHGRLTHPVGIEYAIVASANPDKYRSDINNQSNADLRLVDGQVACTSCHGVHWTDSDAATPDGAADQIGLTASEGKLLRGDGPEQADKSSLCQSCHTYRAHGTSEVVGCLVCHSGHVFGPVQPNYFVLRNSVTTATFNTVSNLDYSSPLTLDPNLKYTFWNDQTDETATGYCEKCHGDAKTIGSGAGEYHDTTAVCTDCHVHGQGQGAFAAACDSCHGFPPGALVTVPGTTGSTTAGAHSIHVENLGLGCAACHYASVGSGPTHLNGDLSITIGFAPDVAPTPGGSYDGQATAQYDAAATTPATTVANTGSKLCSNLYCHGNYPGSGNNASPQWDDAATAACGSCHGGSSSDLPASGSHGIHASDGGFNIPCTACHNGIVSGPGPYAIADRQKHVNGKADWAFDSADSRLRGGAERYTLGSGNFPPSNGTTPRSYGSCENIYCHSNAQPDGGTGNPDSYANPVWGSSGGLTCGSCHRGGVHGDTGPTIASGSHTAHLAYPLHSSDIIECTICHRWNTNPKTSFFGCSNCHPAHGADAYSYVFANHIDGKVTIAFEPTFGALASYNGTTLPGDGYNSCDNSYCHSVGDETVAGAQFPATYNNSRFARPVWGSGPLACNACHGRSTANGAPDYTNGGSGSESANSHAPHVTGNGIGCEKCHFDTTSDGTSITSKTLHVNRVNTDVTFDSLNPDGSYAAGKTCSNTYCHSDGTTVATGYYQPVVPANTSPSWDQSTPDPQGDGFSCNNCHGYPPSYDQYAPKANSHVLHVTQFDYGCETCHYDTTTDGVTIADQGRHGNGQFSIQAAPTHVAHGEAHPLSFDYAFSAGGGTCSNISCHAYWGYNDTRNWGGASLSLNNGFNYSYMDQGCYGITLAYGAPICTPATACEEPFTYTWEFSDGATYTTVGVSSSAYHEFGAPGSYSATLTVIAANGLNGSKDSILFTPLAPSTSNIDPTIAISTSVSGMTATVTDLTLDPDYDFCGKTGEGQVRIVWGDGQSTITSIYLTDQPSNTTFTHTYSSTGTKTLQYYIWDDGGTWWVQMPGANPMINIQ